MDKLGKPICNASDKQCYFWYVGELANKEEYEWEIQKRRCEKKSEGSWTLFGMNKNKHMGVTNW